MSLGIRRNAVLCDVNLHGGAQETLQKGVVQFLSDAGALSQTLIEAGINARGHLPYAEPVKCRRQADTACNAEETEPSGLEPRRRNAEIQGCTRIVPNTVVIAGEYEKLVRARPKLVVIRLAACAYVLPSVIDAIELVAKEHAFGNGKTQGRIVDLQILGVCGKRQAIRTRVGLSVRDDRQDCYRRRQAIRLSLQSRWIQPRDALGCGKPQSPVGGFHHRWFGLCFSREPGKTIQLIEVLRGNRGTRIAQPLLQVGGRDVADA